MTNLSDLFPAGAGKQVSFVADGSISAAGKPVILTAAGKAAEVGESSVALDVPYITTDTAGSVFDANATRICSTLQFDPLVAGRFVVGYNNGSTYYPTILVGEQDGSSITYGVKTVLVSAYTGSWSVALAFDPVNTNQILVQYYDGTATDIEAVSATITGSGASAAFTLGTAVQLYNGAPTALGPQFVAFDPSASATALCLYQYSGPVSKLVVVTMVGNVITKGTAQDLGTEINEKSYNSIAFNSAGTFALAWISRSPNWDQLRATFGSISGTTISVSSTTTGTVIDSSNDRDNALCHFDPHNDNKLAFTYAISSVAKAQIVTLAGAGAGTTVTAGTVTSYFSDQVAIGNACLFDPDTSGAIVFVYQRDDVTAPGDIEARVATYDDSSTSNTITLGTVYLMWDRSATGFPQFRYPSGCVDGVFGMTFVRDDDYDGTVVLGKLETQETNLTAAGLLGISDAAISDTASGNITVKGGIAVNGLTSLTPASDYYAQGDGTISTVTTSPAVKLGRALSATSIDLEYQS